MYFKRKPCTHTFLFVHQLCFDTCRLTREKLKLELTGTLTVFRIKHRGFVRPRTHANGYDHIRTNFMRICLAFTLSFPICIIYPSLSRECLSAFESGKNLSSEQFSRRRHVWTAYLGRIEMDTYKCKAYSHKVWNRNHIWLRVNQIGSHSRYMWMRFLSDEIFFG